MPTCVINAQIERDVAVASIPNACVQAVVSDDSKTYLSTEIEGCKSSVSTELLTTCELAGSSAVYEFANTLESDSREQSN